MDTPVPAPEMVAAARRHLNERYAAGVDRVLWQAEKRPMPDPAAVSAVVAAGNRAEPLDIASALLLVQTIRHSVDQLEYALFGAAREAGIAAAAIAAVLGLPDEAAAQARERWLTARRPVFPAQPPPAESLPAEPAPAEPRLVVPAPPPGYQITGDQQAGRPGGQRHPALPGGAGALRDRLPYRLRCGLPHRAGGRCHPRLGRGGRSGQLAPHIVSTLGRLLLGLADLRLDHPGQLGRLGLRPAFHVCLGHQLFHRFTQLLARPLDLPLQLLRVIGDGRFGGLVRG